MAGSIVRVQPEVLHGLHARQLAGEFEFTDDALAADEMERLQEEHRAFEPGESVMLMVGPFKGFGAIVERHLPDLRLSVLVTVFGRSFPVPMKLTEVARQNG